MTSFSQEIFLVDGLRTAIGAPYRGLKNLTGAQMTSCVVEALVRRNRIKPAWIKEMILGEAVSAGTGQNPARQAVYLSGLPMNIPAYRVNNVCGSGLQSAILAARTIRSEGGPLVLAGGCESVSHAPNLVSKDEHTAFKDKSPIDSVVYDGLWDILTGKHMGELCEDLACAHHIDRKAQDEYALDSHRKAAAARDQGRFSDEIVAVQVGPKTVFEADEMPRRHLNLEKLTDLPPAFRPDGTVTAGNASKPADGAALVLLAGEQAVKEGIVKPHARLAGYASLAVDPAMTFEAGVAAIEQCLKKAQWTIQDVDLFEISEAFAAQAIFTRRALNLPSEKMNISGGDVALGHPLGAAGMRALVTLFHALYREKKDKGLACVCLGGGGAVAMAIERVSSKGLQA